MQVEALVVGDGATFVEGNLDQVEECLLAFEKDVVVLAGHLSGRTLHERFRSRIEECDTTFLIKGDHRTVYVLQDPAVESRAGIRRRFTANHLWVSLPAKK